MPVDLSEPLSEKQLVAYFLTGGRAGESGIGVEFERILLRERDGAAVPYEGGTGVLRVLKELEDRFGWRREGEGGGLLLRKGAAGVVSLEPGGQIELSTPAASSVDAARRCEEALCAELRGIGAELGIVFSGLGFHPIAPISAIDWVPKRRYELMREYFRSKGAQAHAMMKMTASIQVNIDYSDGADAAEKLALAARLAPVLAAMFANSCIAEGRPSGFKSWRSRVWQSTDPDRCGVPACVFRPGFTIDDWVAYALDVPVLFIEREGRLIGDLGMTFRGFLKRGFGPYRAGLADWERHLTCLFPEARLKRWIEIRSADRQSGILAYAPAVLAKLLFYRSGARRAAGALLGALGWEECSAGLAEAAEKGLEGRLGGFLIADLAAELIAMAQAEIRAAPGFLTAFEKTVFSELARGIAEGMSPADRTLRALGAGRGVMELVRESAL